MDPRPPPEVTIEGGPGWQLEGVRERLDPPEVPPQERRPWLDRHRRGGLALAALAGFVAATALADLRTTTIEESPEGVLSLDVSPEQMDYSSGSVVADADGRMSLTTSVVVRNTGPRPVAFERAELLGTPYRSDELGGRRVADGGQSTIALLRAVDCARLERTRAPGPLRVHATTGAGRRTVDLRMNTDVLQFHDDQVRGACGQSEPDQALIVQERGFTVDGTTLRLEVSLSNASALPLAVETMTPAPGLRLTRVTARDGTGVRGGFTPVDLPLALAPGNFDPPVEPYQGRGPEVELALEVEIEDCAVFRPPPPDQFEPAVTFRVTGGRGGNGFGTDPSLLRRLQQASCDATLVRGGAVVTPTSAEQAQVAEDAAERRYFELQRDHPFLTPD